MLTCQHDRNVASTINQRSLSKVCSWNLTQSHEMVLQTSRMHCATSEVTGFSWNGSFQQNNFRSQSFLSQQIPHQLNRSLISLHLFLTAKHNIVKPAMDTRALSISLHLLLKEQKIIINGIFKLHDNKLALILMTTKFRSKFTLTM